MGFWNKKEKENINESNDPIQNLITEYTDLVEFSNGLKHVVSDFNIKLKNYMTENNDDELRKFPFDIRNEIIDNLLVGIINKESEIEKDEPRDVSEFDETSNVNVDLSDTVELRFNQDKNIIKVKESDVVTNETSKLKGLVIYTLDSKHLNTNMNDFIGKTLADEFAKKYEGLVQLNVPFDMVNSSHYDVLLVINELKDELNDEIKFVMSKAQTVNVLPTNVHEKIDLNLIDVNYQLFAPFNDDAIKKIIMHNQDSIEKFKMFIDKSTNISYDITKIMKVHYISLIDIVKDGLDELEKNKDVVSKFNDLEFENILIHDDDSSLALALKNATLKYEMTIAGEIIDNPIVETLKCNVVKDTNVEDYLKLLRSSNNIIHLSSDNTMKSNFTDPMYVFYAKSGIALTPMLERKKLSEDFIENLIAITNDNHVITEEKLTQEYSSEHSIYDIIAN